MSSESKKTKENKMSSQGLNILFLCRFWSCLKIMFPSCLSKTFLLSILLLGLLLGEQMLIYNIGLIPSQFYEVLSSRDEQGFHSLIIVSLCLLITGALGKSLIQYIANLSYVKWRGLLTSHLHRAYLKRNVLYDMNVLDKSVDNPDQRITQDIDRFCRMFRKIISKLCIAPFTVGYYSYRCYDGNGLIGPLSIFGYFVVFAIINKLIMSAIIPLVVKQEKMEGNFRFKHMQVRVNSESLAFYRSNFLEEKRINEKLNDLLDIQEKIVNYEFILNFSVHCFENIGAILSYLIIGIAAFTGKYDGLSTLDLTGVISRGTFVSMYLISCFTKLIDLSGSVSDMAGYTHRIGELIDSLEEKSAKGDIIDDDSFHPVMSSNYIFKFESVSYAAPNALQTMVNNLDITVNRGENMIITGKTGSGKSSLLRVLCGLWKPISGQVLRNLQLTPNNVLFLPQRVLLSDGTLKQQVVYPYDACAPPQQDYHYEENNNSILRLLSDVGLSSVCERLGGINVAVHGSWEDILSPGEMQRLAFARLFYHKPIIALLDEATSALDVPAEKAMYEMCCQLGITVVSIGHRESLIPYHHVNLRLDGDGGWSLNYITSIQ